MSKNSLKVKRLSEDAVIPTRATRQSVGYDLYSPIHLILFKKSKKLIKTDLQILLPEKCYGRIAARSGLACNHFIDVGAGVVDPDYRGNVGVLLFNFGDTNYKINKGDKIAQLICERVYTPELEEIFESTTESTDRGLNGFGSSGK